MNNKYDVPLVSVIISSYNHEKYILDCLQGLFNQDYSNFEVIIRDDGSKDRTPELIQDFINDKNKTHDIPTSVEYGQNVGMMNSANLLLKKTNGYLIMFCASDDEYLPNRIKKAVEAHQKYADFDLVACNAQVVSENGELIRPSFYDLNKEDVNEDVIKFKNQTFKGAVSLALGGFGLSFKKSLIEPIGFQFPDKLLFEDGYLSFLAAIQNGALILKEPLIKYRRSANSMSRVDSTLDRLNIIKQERRFQLMFLSLEEAKLSYLKNNNQVNEIIQKQKAKAIRYIEQKISIIRIKISICDSNFKLKNWLKLLFIFIIGPKSKDPLQILVLGIRRKSLENLIISEYLKRSQIL